MNQIVTPAVIIILFSQSIYAAENLQLEVDNQPLVRLEGRVIYLHSPLIITKPVQIIGPGTISGQIIISRTYEVRLRDFTITSFGDAITIDESNGIWIESIYGWQTDLIPVPGHNPVSPSVNGAWCIRANRNDTLFIRDTLCLGYDGGLLLEDGVNTWISGLVVDIARNVGLLMRPITRWRENTQIINMWTTWAKDGIVIDGRAEMVAKVQIKNNLHLKVIGGRGFKSKRPCKILGKHDAITGCK